MNGYLKIKTRADINNLKKDLNHAKKELGKFKRESENLNNKKLEIQAKVKINTEDYKKKIKQLNEQRQNEILINSKNGVIDSSTKARIDTKYDQKRFNLDTNYEKSIDTANYRLKNIEKQLSKNKIRQNEWNTKIDETNNKISKTDLNYINKGVSNINNSMMNTIKKVARWTIAVLGLRGAYGAVRSAASTLSQYNQKIGTDLEYIRFALASAFQPIIEKLIGLVYKLLAYVNYLAKAWFNIDLFSKATTKNFNSTNKSAKKLQKTLAGFDEINQLSDNSDDGGGEIKTPSMDLSSMEDIEIPQWLKDFADFMKPIIEVMKKVIEFIQKIVDKYGVIGVIGLIVAALAGFIILKKIGNWIKNLGKISKKEGTNLTGFFDNLGKAAKSIAILGGIALVIGQLTGLITAFSESGLSLGEVAGLLGIVLGELALGFVAIAAATKLMDWQGVAGAAVILGGFALIIHEVTNLITSFSKSGLELNDVLGLLTGIMVSLITLVTALTVASIVLGSNPMALVGILALTGSIVALLLIMEKTLPAILDAVGKFITTIAPVVISILETLGKLIENIILALGKSLPPIINSVGNLFSKVFSGIANVVNAVGGVIVNILKTAQNLVITVLTAIINFINQLGPAINNFVDGAIQAVTKLINFLISGVEYMINTLIIKAINSLISKVNKIPLVDIPKFGKVKIERFKPVLFATGGIIDVPKRGVPLASNVVGGEAGAEGVLPLTNQETMSKLGKEIGQWITLNIDLTNTIDGRILNKRLETVKNENNFARNGGA